MPSIYYVPAFHKVIPNLPTADQYIIFVDLQNIAIGKYDTDSDRVLVDDLSTLVRNEVKYILEYLTTVYEKVPNSKVYFFYDEDRNLFNEQIIPTWKDDRKKQLSRLTYDRKTIHSLSSNVSRAVSDTLLYLSKYSLFLNVVKLRYIDSDFIPGISIVTSRNKVGDNTVFLIISSDFDFIHLTQDKNVFIYDSRNRGRFKSLKENNAYIPDTEQMLLKKIGKRYEIKDDEDCVKVYNNYQLIHALVGDQSDSMPPLIKKVGVKTILKKVGDIISEKVVDRIILDKEFGTNFLSKLLPSIISTSLDDLYIQLLQRLLITDFTILASLILEYNNMIEKKYTDSYNFLPATTTRIFKNVVEDISTSLRKEYTTLSKVEQVKRYFNVESDIEKMFLIQ